MDGGSSWKMAHPTRSNDTIQMKSQCSQPPFYAGGNQVPFYLGIKGNHSISSVKEEDTLTPTEKVMKMKR